MEQAPLEILGHQPELAGLVLDDLILEQYRHRGRLEEEANVVWLRVQDTWHRLCFDRGVVFWRREQGGPKPYDMPDLDAAVELFDLGTSSGLAGDRIATLEARAIPRGAEVALRFVSGRSLVFRDVDDHTTYHAG